MKVRILKTLREREGYISGQELCDTLGVSRTAVWKVINQLKEEGYSIEAIQNKGYRLIDGPDILTEAEVLSRLAEDSFGRSLYVYPEVDSTNDQVKRLAMDGAPEGTVVLAGKQLKGKGRRGKVWESNQDTGVWMSVLLRPEAAPSDAAVITLTAGLAVAEAISSFAGLEARIKWPNDIVLGDKKVCGILTEMSTELDYVNFIVVGIGINVNTEHFPEEISHMATSLFLESGQHFNRSALAAACIRSLAHYYRRYREHNSFSTLRKAYADRCITLGRQIRIVEGAREILGEALDIGPDGGLLIADAAGIQREIQSGDVSVRGIYGYI